MGDEKTKRHYENVVDADTFVRELYHDHDIASSKDGKAVIIDTGDSEVVIRPSKSKGIAVDIKTKKDD